jgi:hypothetical protein
MTPDELPADMEAAIAEVEALVLTYADNRQYDAFRALLKAYQEQRRALEPLRRPHWTDDKAIDDLDEDAVIDLTVTVGEFRRIRAALNQKGDER